MPPINPLEQQARPEDTQPPVQSVAPAVQVTAQPNTAPATEQAQPLAVSNKAADRRRYLMSKYKWRFFISIIVAFLLWVLIIFVSLKSANNVRYIIGGLLIPLATYSGWNNFASRHLESQLMQQYAQMHNFIYTNKPSNFHPVGLLFRVGHRKRDFDLISGSLPGINQFILFLHQFTVQHGRSSLTLLFSVVTIYLPETGPHLYLQNRKAFAAETGLLSYSHNIKFDFKQAKEYELEGDFNSSFILYGEAGDQIDLLEIINPAVMERLLGIGPYDIELNGNNLSFYRQGEPATSTEIDSILDVGRLLIASFAPIMQRMDLSANMAQTVQPQ